MFFFFFKLGDVTLSCWKLNTMARESLEHDGKRERTFCSVRHYSSAVCVHMYESVCHI